MNNQINGLPEEEAFMKIYGVVYDNSLRLEEVVVAFEHHKLTPEQFSEEATIYYLFGMDESYADGKLERYIGILDSIYGDDEHPKSFFIEELLAQGMGFYKENYSLINFTDAFQIDYTLQLELSIEVYQNLLIHAEEEWVTQFMNELFIAGISLAQTRPQYEVIGASLN